MVRFVVTVLVTLIGLVALVGCSDDGASDNSTGSRESALLSAEVVPVSQAEQLLDDGARLVDVRTPEEFAAGHLDGAVNVDFEAGDFPERIAELPREETYVVYCASGNRATGAVEAMADLGIERVVNGGGYHDLRGLG